MSLSEVPFSATSIDEGTLPPDAVAPGPSAPGRPPRGWTLAARRRLTLEHLVVLVLGLLVLAVHDVGYTLSLPYWTDEDWVAVTTKFPLSQLPATTSSTPIGWSLLLRVFTVSGAQTARLMPLAFAGAAVVAAYWFARRLDWPRREVSVGAGVLAGIGMLLVPSMLIRDDLKQYTADAFFAVLALAATSRLEREWSRRALVTLSVVTWGGMLVSHTVAFMGAAAFGAVCVVQLARRAWRRLAEAAVAGAGTAVLMGVVYKAFDARAVVPGLTYSPHFKYFYPPVHSGLHAILRFAHQSLQSGLGMFGLGPLWLVGLLFAAGLVTIFLRGRPATAIMLAVLWPEMLAIAGLHLYPFLDTRTSTFLFAVTTVVAAIGVAGVCSLLRPWLKGILAIGLAVAAVAGLAIAARPYVRSHMIPSENMSTLVSYAAQQIPANDVILVAQDANFGFAYYWPAGTPSREADSAILQEYEAYFPGQPRIVVALSRDPAGVDAALAQALAESRQRGCTPIYLLRTHVTSIEENAYDDWLDQRHLGAYQVGQPGWTIVRPTKSLCQ